jgi:hypothetical protein
MGLESATPFLGSQFNEVKFAKARRGTKTAWIKSFVKYPRIIIVC